MIKKSFNFYIVHVPNKLVDTIETETLTLYKNPAMADGFDHQRNGIVVCDMVFDTFGIKKGDKVFFHHNITAEWMNMEGIRETSDWCIDYSEGLYKIPPSEIYGYERDGVFKPTDDFCFVEAEYTYNIDPDKFTNIVLPDTNKVEAKNYGRIVYGNKFLKKNNIKKGDSVYFDPHSKYPFPVNGVEYWRMKNKWLIGKRDEAV